MIWMHMKQTKCMSNVIAWVGDRCSKDNRTYQLVANHVGDTAFVVVADEFPMGVII